MIFDTLFGFAIRPVDKLNFQIGYMTLFGVIWKLMLSWNRMGEIFKKAQLTDRMDKKV